MQIEGETVIVVTPEEAIAFPAAERLRTNIMKLARESECNVILDCKNLKRIDVTVAKVNLFVIDVKDANVNIRRCFRFKKKLVNKQA